MLPKIGDMFSMLLVLERVLNMLRISNISIPHPQPDMYRV